MIPSFRSNVRTAAGVAVMALVASALGPTVLADLKAGPNEAVLTDDLRNELEGVLQKKVKSLLDLKNGDGQSYKRAIFSKSFKKIDEATYQVALLQDTASTEKLLTERFLVTLKNVGGVWTVASEDLKDSYNNLSRRVGGDEKFFTFERFSFAREGLKVTASKGWLFQDFRLGKVEGLTLSAQSIQYEFSPPDPKFTPLYQKLRKDRPADVIFEPDIVDIACDTVSCEDILTMFTGLAPSTPDAADPKLRSKYEETQKDLKKSRKENNFGGFELDVEPGHRHYSLVVAKESPKRRVGLTYDNWEPREVGFWAYSLDKIFPSYDKVYHYYSEETLKSHADPYALEMRDDADARDYDLTGLKGTVEMALHESETMEADLVYTMKIKRDLRELPFFIARLKQTEDEKKDIKDPSLIVNSIEDGEGREMTWVKLGPYGGIVVLPEPVSAGGTVSLRVRFMNKAGIYAVTPTFSYVSRFGWMPFVRFTDMINDFDLTIKVPARYKALGIGRKVTDTIENGAQVTRWVADSPVEFPSIIFGDYLDRESTVKATKSDGTPIPVWIHVDKLGKTTGAEKHLEDLADQAANSLNLYREIFGVDYPYGKLDLVNDPFGSFYGQSPSSLIYLGNGVFLGSSKAAALSERASLSKFNREVVPHEVGHQWWGSLIPNHNNGNYWFVESLAEYSSALYVENSEGDLAAGKAAYQDKVAEWRRRVLDTDLQSSVQDASVLWTGSMFRGYQAAVYNKGPYAFHIMRMTWGDEKFFKFLKMMAQDLKNHAIVTRDIQKEAEKAFGGNMDFFFDQWLRGIGLPEYTFSYSTRATEDGKYLVEGHIDQRILVGQKKDPLDGQFFTAIVPITVSSKNGKEYKFPLKVQGATTPFKFKVAERPKDITLNKYGEALAYDVIVKANG